MNFFAVLLSAYILLCSALSLESDRHYAANVGRVGAADHGKRRADLIGASSTDNNEFKRAVESGHFLSCPGSCGAGMQCCCEGFSLSTCHATAGHISCFNPAATNCCGCIGGLCFTCRSDESCIRHSFDFSCAPVGSRVYFSGGDGAGLAIGILFVLCLCGGCGWWGRRRRMASYSYSTISSSGPSYGYQTSYQPVAVGVSHHHRHHQRPANVGYAASASSGGGRPANAGYAASAAQPGYAASAAQPQQGMARSTY